MKEIKDQIYLEKYYLWRRFVLRPRHFASEDGSFSALVLRPVWPLLLWLAGSIAAGGLLSYVSFSYINRPLGLLGFLGFFWLPMIAYVLDPRRNFVIVDGSTRKPVLILKQLNIWRFGPRVFKVLQPSGKQLGRIDVKRGVLLDLKGHHLARARAEASTGKSISYWLFLLSLLSGRFTYPSGGVYNFVIEMSGSGILTTLTRTSAITGRREVSLPSEKNDTFWLLASFCFVLLDYAPS